MTGRRRPRGPVSKDRSCLCSAGVGALLWCAPRAPGAAKRLAASICGDSPEPLCGSEEEAIQPRLRPPQLQRPHREHERQDGASVHRVDIAQRDRQDKHSQHRLRQVVGQRHPPDCAQALLEPVVRAVVPEDDEAHVSQRGGDRAKRVGNLADEGYLAGVVVHCGFLSRTDETAPDANAVPPQPKPTVTDELVPGNKQLYVPSVLNAAPG